MHVEFNVRVANYAERAQLTLQNPPNSYIQHWLGDGRAGLNLELIGHGSSIKVLLQLSHLPYVQVFQSRQPDAPYLNPSLEYQKNWSSEKVALC